MATTTPEIMATSGPSLFDTVSAVGSPVIVVITGLLIFVDVLDFVDLCVGSVDSVGKIDNQIIEIFAIDYREHCLTIVSRHDLSTMKLLVYKKYNEK